jgi:dipeptidyl aminopeptidase/acylaminoacyl peptidase
LVLTAFIVAGVTLLIRIAMGDAGESLKSRWITALRSGQWVFASAGTSQPSSVPAPVDRLLVGVAGVEHTVYTTTESDFELGEPVVSPDGTRIAFIKVEGSSRAPQQFLYVMNVDGSGLQRVLELEHVGIPIRGARIGPSPCAWSPDNRRLAVWSTPKGDRRESAGSGGIAPRVLFTVEVSTGRIQRLRFLGRRTPGQGIWGSVITTQAWAPDSRRLVYMKDDGHATALDIETDTERDLGIGTEPTWSPDGEFIAVRLPHEPGTDGQSRHGGDYVRIGTRTLERVRLLENQRSVSGAIGLSGSQRAGYFGPALWTPDGEFIIVSYLGRSEYIRRYVVDRRSGEVADVSRDFTGVSIGGGGRGRS